MKPDVYAVIARILIDVVCGRYTREDKTFDVVEFTEALRWASDEAIPYLVAKNAVDASFTMPWTKVYNLNAEGWRLANACFEAAAASLPR